MKQLAYLEALAQPAGGGGTVSNAQVDVITTEGPPAGGGGSPIVLPESSNAGRPTGGGGEIALPASAEPAGLNPLFIILPLVFLLALALAIFLIRRAKSIEVEPR